MMKGFAVVLALVGCTDDRETYLNWEVKPGELDSTSESPGDWTTGYIRIAPDGENMPPGVFTLRISEHPTFDQRARPIMGARLLIDPAVSACAAKSEVRCGDRYCYAELVQPTLGLCLVDITALVGDERADSCWVMGTYPRSVGPSDADEELIHAHNCGGTLTR